MQEILFPEVCAAYLSERIVNSLYASNMMRAARKCGTISKDRLNAYLRERASVVSMTSVANERRMLLTAWRWAFDNGHVSEAPRGIMTIRQVRQPVRAWTVAELGRVVNATSEKSDRHMASGVTQADFLRCWILLGYETGARWGDLWSMRAGDFHGNMLRFTANKTGSPIYRVLSDDCIEAVHVMLDASPDTTVLGFAAKKRNAMRIMRRHLKDCGLDGSSKWLRRSGATHVEKTQSGQAKVFLGHRTAGLAERHYIDWAQLGGDAIVVPRIYVAPPGEGEVSCPPPSRGRRLPTESDTRRTRSAPRKAK